MRYGYVNKNNNKSTTKYNAVTALSLSFVSLSLTQLVELSNLPAA